MRRVEYLRNREAGFFFQFPPQTLVFDKRLLVHANSSRLDYPELAHRLILFQKSGECSNDREDITEGRFGPRPEHYYARVLARNETQRARKIKIECNQSPIVAGGCHQHRIINRRAQPLGEYR
jgi:hypothetical protein